jgi:hypothetical protein
VRKDGQILWNVVVLECETYASIDDITIDARVCEPQCQVYPGTDIVYWIGTVKRDLTESGRRPGSSWGCAKDGGSA